MFVLNGAAHPPGVVVFVKAAQGRSHRSRNGLGQHPPEGVVQDVAGAIAGLVDEGEGGAGGVKVVV